MNSSRRILLMYISKVSGHRQATKAIEKSIKKVLPDASVSSVNGFGETFPLTETIINCLYMIGIRFFPQLWDWMYDNPKLVERSHQTRERIFAQSHPKIQRILEEHQPDTIVCSQAFPCGMVAHYKMKHQCRYKVIGVLTDYAPHSYWINDGVDYYVVPSEHTRAQLEQKGVDPHRIKVLGIPIRYTFAEEKPREALCEREGFEPSDPVVLIMGGGHGLGPIKQTVKALLASDQPMQLIVIAGANKGLWQWLQRVARQAPKKMLVYEYNPNIDELMTMADLIVTKPGGMTTAECLAKGLPMVIVKPLPGQERCNTEFLVDNGIGIHVKNMRCLAQEVAALLADPSRLHSMTMAARQHAYPYSAKHIAELIEQNAPEQELNLEF